MPERVASSRPRQLRLKPPRPAPLLRAEIVVRWKCRRCGTLHLDRSARDADGIPPFPWDKRQRRALYTYADTTKCCGEDWCFDITPLPAPAKEAADA